MSPTDSRFGKIAAQKFILIEPAIQASSAGWLDPRDVESKQTSLAVVQPVAVISPPVEVTHAPASPEVPELAQPAAPANAPVADHLTSLNTPATPGRMLGDRLKPSPDWQAPAVAEPSNAKVVKPGAKVRLGS